MKRNIAILLFAFALGLSAGSRAQSSYWVFLTDKAGTTFDPYSYFDSKAIERYRLNNADLYDITNYPLNDSYLSQIEAIVKDDMQPNTEVFGQSRWFNAVAVTATPQQIEAIGLLPFVREVVMLGGDMQTAGQRIASDGTEDGDINTIPMVDVITDQLLRMQGHLFMNNGIDGSGIRIAVFDGGFHAVNTHKAFKHLRDKGLIVATWDFTKKQENVYDNHTHGTMVLSCIAGMIGQKHLGLATGASFLLAKTEVEPEPYKEEVWWAQAMEWADRNGADIINSSLGYTKDRHYTYQMDGRSYVSRAANIAARKGMLVCNSAGNSGDDRNWKIIGAPADADSILSVGGIAATLNSYRHISFSSYGPTADGRMKPNVCNYGIAECADPHNDTATTFAAGTSFSSPLTTGFAACAWQMMRDRTAMQMKEQIEKSADLYPYFDYALGYGVPQASFFTDQQQPPKSASFSFEERAMYVLIKPSPKARRPDSKQKNKEVAVMFKLVNGDGIIDEYVNLGLEDFNDTMYIALPKGALYNKTLVANYDGTTLQYRLSFLDSIKYANEDHSFSYHVIDTSGFVVDNYDEYIDRTLEDNKTSKWGVGKQNLLETYFQGGMPWYFGIDGIDDADAFNFGERYMRFFRKWYAVGVAIEIAFDDYYYLPADASPWDTRLGIAAMDFSNVEEKNLELLYLNLELFQRFRLIQHKDYTHKGLYLDLGAYGGFVSNIYSILFNENQNAASTSVQHIYNGVEGLGRFVFGVTTRLSFESIGLYARYRFLPDSPDIPHFQIGLQFNF